MKILFVADAQSIHTKRWAGAFRDQGDEVHIATFNVSKIDGVQVHQLYTYGLGKLGYFLAIPRLKSLGKKLRPDVVHAHYVTSYGFLAATAHLRPLILTAWGSDVLVNTRKSIVLRWFTHRALIAADCVTTVAEHMNQAIQDIGIRSTEIIAVPFGVDVELFRPPMLARNTGATFRIISTRNFHPIYSIHTVLEAVHFLHTRGVAVNLELVGDGPLRQELERLVDTLGIKTLVQFHGHVDHTRLVTLLGRAHVFVSSAVSDGSNVSLLEAMACGCIPIATRIPANEQWITHEKNGFLFPSGNYTILSEMIERAGDPSRWEAIISENRQIVEERANWKTSVRNMRKIYSELVNRMKGL